MSNFRDQVNVVGFSLCVLVIKEICIIIIWKMALIGEFDFRIKTQNKQPPYSFGADRIQIDFIIYFEGGTSILYIYGFLFGIYIYIAI